MALIGPNVTNEGTISTPDGQTILAAGMQVGFDAHSADDPSLRGLDVYVGDVGTYGGTATNNGLIESPRGSVVITGKAVNQNGFINSSTSVSLNGRIDLLANYGAVRNTNYNAANAAFGAPFQYPSNTSTGIVRTKEGSVMQILPEWASSSKINGTELALKSEVNIQGLGIYLGEDSVILAPNANVAISAGIWDLVAGNPAVQNFVQSSGQVYLDHGAVIDVAGSTAIDAAISEYIFTVTLRGAELADSALQRNGSLRGATITVDLRKQGVRSDGTAWVGTPLANLTGYLGVIERTVGQLTTAGGAVSLTAGDSVVIQDGASVNVSGGYQDFAGGDVATTRLVDDGNLIDIADADPSVVYDGIYTGATTVADSRWGTSTTTTGLFASTSHYEPAHSFGGKGGSLAITAASMALDGALKGNTVIGPQQLGAAPQMSTLSLKFQAQQLIRTPLLFPLYSPTPPVVEFQNGSIAQAAVGSFPSNGSLANLPTARRSNVFLSPELFTTQGFGSLLMDNSDGDILVPANVSLTVSAGGTILLHGANVNIQGSLSAPGGHLELIAYNVSPYVTANLEARKSQLQRTDVPAANPARGKVTVGSSALLSTAGLIINDLLDAPAPLSVPRSVTISSETGEVEYLSTTQGGSISIQAYTAELAAGSLVDVSGGLTANKSITYGNGGSLSIHTGNDPLIKSLLGGHLSLGATLKGFSGAVGGTLTLQAPTIQVGGSTVYPNTLLLQPDFFGNGGFSKFTLTGLGSDITPPAGVTTFAPGILITSGTVIRPLVSSLQASSHLQNGTSSIAISTLLQPEGYRSPASLDFEAPGVNNFIDSLLQVRGAILMESGTQIETDALGSVVLHGQTVEMLGSIDAPGGSVTLAGASHYPVELDNLTTAIATVHLGSVGRVSTAGKTVLLMDAFNRRVGSVHAGGSIHVEGNIVADAGALLDVSGTSSIMDLLPAEAGVELASQNSITQLTQAASSVPVRIDSNGGLISLKGGEFLFSNATLLGTAGGSTAQGGNLYIGSGRFIAPGAASDDKFIKLVVSQDMSSFLQPVFVVGQSVVGQSIGGTIVGQGYFGANSFQNGGFDSLTLANNVEFRGAVDIVAKGYLKVADGGVLSADSLVRLAAPYVALGRTVSAPMRDEELINPYLINTPGVGVSPSLFSPTYGTGRLEVVADLIETGFLSLQKIGQASLTARQELRASDYFDIAGHLTITAGQIVPMTASTFTITAYNDSAAPTNGSVTIASTGTSPEFPLSGGGRLSIYASSITQGGILRAALGSIRLGWDGVGTAPKGLVTNANAPVTQQITLTGSSVTSVSAIDPQTGAGVRIPYGLIKDGTNWIDPTGFDITSTGIADKTIRLSALNVTTEAGSNLDIRGGGELYGYRWVQGNGGSTDLLDTDEKFAIVPGFSSLFAPYAPFATGGIFVSNLGGDTGYTTSGLKIGDQIYLKGSSLTAAGNYTLMPARYALQPGALLITPSSGLPVDSLVKPGGAVFVSGYRFNGLNPGAAGSIHQLFEIAPQQVVKVRAEYTDYLAHEFIPAAQNRLSLPVTRTSSDAGYSLLSALQSMQLSGNVSAAGTPAGRGGRVDISSPLEIVITAPGAPAQLNKLVLNSTLLSGWNAESLHIGGERTTGTTSTVVTVRTDKLTVDNAGAPLTGTEIILAAKQTITLAANAVITQTGTQTSADSLALSGNGSLVRVSGVTSAQTSRTGVTTSALPQLNVAAGVSIRGASITLDSSNTTSLDNSTSLTGTAINLNSGRVSLLLTPPPGSPNILQTTGSLVLGGTALASLQNTAALSLLSYTSIDLYGSGTFSNTGTLALHAAEIRGFNNAGGTVNLTAQSILLDNSANGTAGTAGTLSSSTLNVTADTISIGQNALVVNQFATVVLNAASGILMQGTGSFAAQGDINAVTPFFTAASSATQSLMAGGALNLTKPSGTQPLPAGLGLGAQVSFEGSSITANTDVLLPSGQISMRARTGSLSIGGRLDVGGTAKSFFDQVRYTDAGQVTLTSDNGNVTLGTTGTINVAAAAAGGNAGNFIVNAGAGLLTLDGSLLGQGGIGGTNASAKIDIVSLASFNTLNAKLNAGSFTQERNLRLRSGSVTIDSTIYAHRFFLGVDQGSITVNVAANPALPTIDASGSTGGRIDLIANGDVTLNSGAWLTVKGTDFDNAGKGGEINLESGAQRNGTVGAGSVMIQTGSVLDLSVTNNDKVTVSGVTTTVAGSSAYQGKFTGKLHIRAPQTTAINNYIQVSPINGTIINPSSIVIEGYKLYDFNQSNVVIQGGVSTLPNLTGVTLKTEAASGQNLKSDATSFMANYSAMLSRLVGGNTGIQALESQGPGVVVIAPGIEISNRGGNITLGIANVGSGQGSGAAYDWDLAGFRFGPKNAAGVLTMRASGNLEFYNTLSDGFNTAAATSTNALEKQWTAPLMSLQTTLPTNTQSWSYRMASGADFRAASFKEVVSLNSLSANSGSVLLGKDAVQARPVGTTSGANAQTSTAIRQSSTATNATTQSNRFQVIRTGTGNIEIAAARDVQLLNQFATIYSAGAQVADPYKVVTSGDFVLPVVDVLAGDTPNQGTLLGAVQQLYPALYSMAGGNIMISAQASIKHSTRNSGVAVADSSRELPNNWLMRRGYIDPLTGEYGDVSVFQDPIVQVNALSSSTSWWVNFSNFFDGVGALGGGNVLLQSGQNIENVSAHAPTNARAASGTPDASRFIELGGGDVTVRAGVNIDGGIYYVERGVGVLNAGSQITTNLTRSPSLGRLGANLVLDDESTWLPTTLFAGKTSFDIKARGDLLLGPVANTFLLPQGINNKVWNKTYFSTFSAESSVKVSSIAGSVTLREAATLIDGSAPLPILSAWMRKELLLNNASAANIHPWLRLLEVDITPFNTYATVMPASVSAISFSGDVNVVGTINLFPSPKGSLELLAAGAVQGLHKTGASTVILSGSKNNVWASSSINVSDASPGSIPGIYTPYAYYDFLNRNSDYTLARTTNATFLNQKNATFTETGSTAGRFGVSQVKQSLHDSELLHLNDANPARIYAVGGDLSGVTLFSSKFATILAQRDITDVGLYIQNVRESDVTTVSSGRDIVAYNANTSRRTQAAATGNRTANGETPKSGDIQISGPGSLQVLSGRNLNLGTGSNNSDGTGVGITSIGNGRNPYLPFAGADVVVAAGMGKASTGLSGSNADFASFITQFTTSPAGDRYLTELAEILGVPSVNLHDPLLTPEQQKQLALAVYYLVLRDAGRDHNDPDSPNAGTYTEGYAAIASLFPTTSTGSIETQARDIRTKSGGDISILAPAGGLQLAATLIGDTLAPPGVITESGGNVSIFTKNDVDIGISRIFTLRGGDIMIWSSEGDIAAGSSSKTVQSAPPTRVLIDPQSADIATDLAGLATGGGIGVLATVAGVRPGNVDLIAPIGAVDAGDAGIRATGNLNIAASIVLNSANISVGGTSAGTPAAPSVASPSLGGLASAASSAGAASTSAASQPGQNPTQQPTTQELPSIIDVQVIGYGGGDGSSDERKRDQPGE
ncbi:MAG: filamentous hemagglutinin family protein [Prosthecobacter sp.]|uniref:filamentous haemagglutinin family protein n=1 Tax=Prosthecobacter sp. TaxID=1965333 RepID=UPI0039007A30